ncbi:MAG: hypothetical protein C4523_05765 [Myxococcales bacterium]|nr:MAG: hypothetical protein C4523_05765 [Myxococcales bacterium]
MLRLSWVLILLFCLCLTVDSLADEEFRASDYASSHRTPEQPAELRAFPVPVEAIPEDKPRVAKAASSQAFPQWGFNVRGGYAYHFSYWEILLQSIGARHGPTVAVGFDYDKNGEGVEAGVYYSHLFASDDFSRLHEVGPYVGFLHRWIDDPKLVLGLGVTIQPLYTFGPEVSEGFEMRLRLPFSLTRQFSEHFGIVLETALSYGLAAMVKGSNLLAGFIDPEECDAAFDDPTICRVLAGVDDNDGLRVAHGFGVEFRLTFRIP